MIEETNQTATPEMSKTDTTFVPDWEKKAEKLEEMVKQGLGKQVGYKSVDGQVVEPVLLTTEQQDNVYPIAIDKPVGFIAPAYSWSGEQLGYYETAPAYQGRKIQELADGLNKVVKDQEQIKQEQANADKEKQADDKQNSQTLKLVTMIASQLGVLTTKIDTLSKKQAAETANPIQSTPQVANAEPTQSADNKGGEQ